MNLTTFFFYMYLFLRFLHLKKYRKMKGFHYIDVYKTNAKILFYFKNYKYVFVRKGIYLKKN